MNSFFLTRYSEERLRNHFDTVTRRAVKRVLRICHRVVGIAVDGSVGRASPMPYSDIDIFVLVRGDKPPDQIHYIDHGCYVSVGFSTLKREKQRGIDFFWSRGGAKSSRILYDPAGILGKRIEERRLAKPSPSTVDEALFESYSNIIEYAGKLRNGWLSSNGYLVRYAARIIAWRSEEVVMALNNLSPITENIIWNLVMKAKRKPAHFRSDYPVARGYETAVTRRVFESGLRLAKESLRLVKDEYAGKTRSKNFRSLLGEPLDEIGL